MPVRRFRSTVCVAQGAHEVVCGMDRRNFLRGAVLAALVPGAWPAGAFSLPSNPVFGRSFADLQGGQVVLSKYLGRPVVLNFWASWCAPCVREMPMLEALHHGNPKLAVVGLAIDTRPNVERFLQKVTVSYDLYLGGMEGIPLMRDLGNKQGGLPFTAFFDAEGRLAGTVVGELREEAARSWIARILPPGADAE